MRTASLEQHELLLLCLGDQRSYLVTITATGAVPRPLCCRHRHRSPPAPNDRPCASFPFHPSRYFTSRNNTPSRLSSRFPAKSGKLMGHGAVINALTGSSQQKKHEERRAKHEAERAERAKAEADKMRRREDKYREQQRAADAARMQQMQTHGHHHRPSGGSSGSSPPTKQVAQQQQPAAQVQQQPQPMQQPAEQQQGARPAP